MAVTDWKTPGTAASVDRDGKTEWSYPDNAKVSDNARASNAVGKSLYSDWLRLTSFGFTTSDIPSGATIVGIEAKVERSATYLIQDSALYLRKTSGQTGNNKASASYYAASDEQVTYGGAADMWGTSLVDTDIRNSDFGIDISVYGVDTSNSPTAYIDCVWIRIYYTAGTTHYGVAALAGSGALVGKAKLDAKGKSVLSGIGALVGKGIAIYIGKSTLSGEGALVGKANLTAIGKATLTGAGGLTGLGKIIASGKATLAGAGSLAGIGKILAVGKATLSGVGTLAAIGRRWVYGKVGLGGVGTLSGKARLLTYGKAIFTGTGSLSAIGEVFRGIYGAASLAGSGAMAAKARIDGVGKATLSGVGSLVAKGLAILTGKATMAGSGSLHARSGGAIRFIPITIQLHKRILTLKFNQRAIDIQFHKRTLSVKARTQEA